MEYENPDEMTFGFSKHPVKTKNGLEIGAGYVESDNQSCSKRRN